MRVLLEQPTLISSFGFAAADRVRMRYSWEQPAQEGEQVCTEALRRFWTDAPSALLQVSGAAFG